MQNVASYLSSAVAGPFSVAFQAQRRQVQRVQFGQRLHCSHVKSCPLRSADFRKTQIPEHTALVRRRRRQFVGGLSTLTEHIPRSPERKKLLTFTCSMR